MVLSESLAFTNIYLLLPGDLPSWCKHPSYKQGASGAQTKEPQFSHSGTIPLLGHQQEASPTRGPSVC